MVVDGREPEAFGGGDFGGFDFARGAADFDDQVDRGTAILAVIHRRDAYATDPRACESR